MNSSKLSPERTAVNRCQLLSSGAAVQKVVEPPLPVTNQLMSPKLSVNTTKPSLPADWPTRRTWLLGVCALLNQNDTEKSPERS